jgi:hypothetical protein
MAVNAPAFDRSALPPLDIDFFIRSAHQGRDSKIDVTASTEEVIAAEMALLTEAEKERVAIRDPAAFEGAIHYAPNFDATMVRMREEEQGHANVAIAWHSFDRFLRIQCPIQVPALEALLRGYAECLQACPPCESADRSVSVGAKADDEKSTTARDAEEGNQSEHDSDETDDRPKVQFHYFHLRQLRDAMPVAFVTLAGVVLNDISRDERDLLSLRMDALYLLEFVAAGNNAPFDDPAHLAGIKALVIKAAQLPAGDLYHSDAAYRDEICREILVAYQFLTSRLLPRGPLSKAEGQEIRDSVIPAVKAAAEVKEYPWGPHATRGLDPDDIESFVGVVTHLESVAENGMTTRPLGEDITYELAWSNGAFVWASVVRFFLEDFDADEVRLQPVLTNAPLPSNSRECTFRTASSDWCSTGLVSMKFASVAECHSLALQAAEGLCIALSLLVQTEVDFDFMAADAERQQLFLKCVKDIAAIAKLLQRNPVSAQARQRGYSLEWGVAGVVEHLGLEDVPAQAPQMATIAEIVQSGWVSVERLKIKYETTQDPALKLAVPVEWHTAVLLLDPEILSAHELPDLHTSLAIAASRLYVVASRFFFTAAPLAGEKPADPSEFEVVVSPLYGLQCPSPDEMRFYFVALSALSHLVQFSISPSATPSGIPQVNVNLAAAAEDLFLVVGAAAAMMSQRFVMPGSTVHHPSEPFPPRSLKNPAAMQQLLVKRAGHPSRYVTPPAAWRSGIATARSDAAGVVSDAVKFVAFEEAALTRFAVGRNATAETIVNLPSFDAMLLDLLKCTAAPLQSCISRIANRTLQSTSSPVFSFGGSVAPKFSFGKPAETTATASTFSFGAPRTTQAVAAAAEPARFSNAMNDWLHVHALACYAAGLFVTKVHRTELSSTWRYWDRVSMWLFDNVGATLPLAMGTIFSISQVVRDTRGTAVGVQNPFNPTPAQQRLGLTVSDIVTYDGVLVGPEQAILLFYAGARTLWTHLDEAVLANVTTAQASAYKLAAEKLIGPVFQACTLSLLLPVKSEFTLRVVQDARQRCMEMWFQSKLDHVRISHDLKAVIVEAVELVEKRAVEDPSSASAELHHLLQLKNAALQRQEQQHQGLPGRRRTRH